MVADDCFFLELRRGRLLSHQLNNFLFHVHSVEELAACREELGEFSEVEAGDGLLAVFDVVVGRDDVDEDFDQVQVVFVVEEVGVFLPELFGVDGAPPQLPLAQLLFEFLDRGKHFVVLVDVLVERVQQVRDVLVDPVAVQQLRKNVQRVYVRQNLQANLVVLQVLQAAVAKKSLTSKSIRMMRTFFSLLK